ncbi:peptidoglycan-recognition protein LF-like isoform X3 [Ochlerotatus camptorhynchus]|uniref:peptidoglycan-recognition protein LF-like isoform X3 n=1 Tax=Ochlerotatus camptorhynchus TaxID=644619 RepID=UPI0031CF9A0A
MAKAKSQPNTPSAAPDSVPSSSTSLPTVSDNCIGVSNIAVVQPSQGTAVDKTDASSSHNISISSINEDEKNDSSAFESSDSECDDEQIKKAIERIPNSLQPGSQLVQNGMLVVKDDNSSPVSARGPNIGSIAVQNSSDITFGNKTYIKGQVVIKNIYHDKHNGTVNNGYNETDGELGGSKQSKDTSTKCNKPSACRYSLKVIIRDKPMLSVIILIAVMIIIVALIIVVYVATSADNDFFPDAKPLRLVTRNEWLAQPPKEKLTPLKLPVNRVIIAHTATEGCTTQAQCSFMTQRIQEFHMAEDSKNYSDIAYNFLVGGDGNAYVGRDWDKQGAHTKGFNVDSICIAFIGTFTDIQPSVVQLSAAEQLIAMGLKDNKLSKHYRLYGHRQLAPFESPGRMLYKIIQKWPHWASELGPNHWQE